LGPVNEQDFSSTASVNVDKKARAVIKIYEHLLQRDKDELEYVEDMLEKLVMGGFSEEDISSLMFEFKQALTVWRNGVSIPKIIQLVKVESGVLLSAELSTIHDWYREFVNSGEKGFPEDMRGLYVRSTLLEEHNLLAKAKLFVSVNLKVLTVTKFMVWLNDILVKLGDDPVSRGSCHRQRERVVA
jgi:hypothetical protein